MVMRFDDSTAVLNLRVWSRAGGVLGYALGPRPSGEASASRRTVFASATHPGVVYRTGASPGPDAWSGRYCRPMRNASNESTGDVLWRFSAYRRQAPMKGMPLQTNPELRERFVIAAQHQPNQHFPGRVPATRADAYSLYLTSNLVEDDQWFVGGLPVVG
jgi:hypothetical protein